MSSRFIVTKSVPVEIPIIKNGKRIGTKRQTLPIAGYWIGPGKRSVLTLHRRLKKELERQAERHHQRRFVWWDPSVKTVVKFAA